MTAVDDRYTGCTTFVLRILADGTWEAEHCCEHSPADLSWFSVASWMNGTAQSHRATAGSPCPADAIAGPSTPSPRVDVARTTLGGDPPFGALWAYAPANRTTEADPE